MAGWLRGTVKEVNTGDTITIVGTSKIVPPPEKRITLSSLIAPKLGKRDGSVRDEPFAFQSREYLRKKLIGQSVVFKIDYVVEQLGNREFGSVFLNEKENVAVAVVTNGWAKLRGMGKEQSPFMEELKKAEEAAQIKGVGLWNKDSTAIAESMRSMNIGGDEGGTAASILASVGKNRPVTVMVEQVLNGSTLRVVLPDMRVTTLTVAGVQCPSLGRRILEVSSATETAVCNLGSVNLSRHVVRADDGSHTFDFEQLASTVRTAVRQLDRVIDLNFYPIDTARTANIKWRPVGLGVMGLQDVFFKLRLPFDSAEALALSTRIAEEIYFHALTMSNEVAQQVGAHPGFDETRAANGELQFDYWPQAQAHDIDRWDALRERIKEHGLRNSLLIAIAPTATIASIAGCYECIEPQIEFQGIDKYQNLFASVRVAAVDGAEGTESLAEALIRAGYAKVVEWSANLMVNGMKLREIEKVAKAEKRALWTNYVPTATGQTKLSDAFTGKVIEVVSGDCLCIKDNATRVERRVTLSSIRAPRPAARERAGDPWASEAKEFLRKRLVGKEVEVRMEYTRKVMTTDMMLAGDAERVMSFGNVELLPESRGEEKQNVSELIVARGFGTVVRHRTDEERSSVAASGGVHSAKEPPINRVNDVSQPGSGARAKLFLPFLQRAGRVAASVEYVLSGHRLRLHIAKEGATIVFAPSGIKTPSRAMPAGNGKPAQQAEPYADEAIAFTREAMLQRDVEIVVETVDRGGTFLGSVVIPGPRPVSLSLALLRAGLGRIQPNMDPARLENGAALAEAQAAAQAARLKIWEKWEPEAEAPEGSADAGASHGGSSPEEVLEVVVTDVVDASEFFVQIVNEPRIQWIAQQLAELPPVEGIPPMLKAGQLCLGLFSLDRSWYRAYVEKVNATEPTYEVFFIDFGNREQLSSKAVRSIDAALAAVPAQAHLASLAHVKVPLAGADHSLDARACLTQLVGGGQPLLAQVSSRERPEGKSRHPRSSHGKLIVSLVDPENGVNVAVEMLLAGMARLPKLRKVRDPAAREAISKMAEYEEEAKAAHRGVFQYGDPGDSDDETLDGPKGKASAWGARK
ncbi:MAG: hypothetical protein WDW36_007269 [Sanguina aurantia]